MAPRDEESKMFKWLVDLLFHVAQMVRAAGAINQTSSKQREHEFKSHQGPIFYYFPFVIFIFHLSYLFVAMDSDMVKS